VRYRATTFPLKGGFRWSRSARSVGQVAQRMRSASKEGWKMDEVVTVESWRGTRIWRRIGEVDHVTPDGRKVNLAEWEGTCTICDKLFRLLAWSDVRSAGQSKSLATTTCPEHRLTPSESSRIGRASAKRRPAVFEAIKKARLDREANVMTRARRIQA
jgi:hypothetical protein